MRARDFINEEYSWVIQHKDSKRVIGTFKDEDAAKAQFDTISPTKRNQYAVKNVPHKHDDLEENWKKSLGALLTTGGLALSPMYQADKPVQEPAPKVQQVTKPEVKPEVKSVAPKQEVSPSMAKQVQSGLASAIGQTLLKAAKAEGLEGEELAQFLAQCSHETQNFRRLRETGGRLDFKRYDIAHNPRIARALGNTRPGDGFRYIGRGYIHLTGKDNYRRAAKALGIPIDQSPAMLERPDIAAKVSVWYWKNRVANKVDDFSNTKAVTKPINSSLSGLEDRHERFKAIGNLLGITTV